MIEVPKSVAFPTKHMDSFERIACQFLRGQLRKINYDTCKVQTGGVVLPDSLYREAVERVAAELKSLGYGWEQLT